MRKLHHIALACGLAGSACSAEPKPARDAATKGEAGADAKPSTKSKPVAPEKKKDLPPADGIITAHVEAVGGRDAMAGFETLYFESSVDTGAQNISAKAKTWWKKGRFYGEQEIPGFGLARSGYDGTTVWVDDPINGLRKLEGKEAEQIIREGAIFLVADWETHFEKAETVDAREVDGRGLVDVKLTSRLGEEVTMSFGADDNLLARMSFEQITPTGTVPVTAVFDDYRIVDGVKFAHKSTLEIALGAVTQTYDKVVVNEPVDETKFAFPGSAGAVPADPQKAQPTPAAPPN